MNRKQCRHSGKPAGMSYANALAYKQQLLEACRQAANDKTIQVKSDIQTQRAMWLMCVAMNDAFGIGPERFQKFARCLQERAEWFDALVRDGDEVYAVEKLRQDAERCSGAGITYLYEQDILAAQEKHSKTGWQQP